MKPLYLRFDTKEAAEEALINCSHPHEIDVIGEIYNDDSEYSDDGECIKQPTKKQGWHVNLLVPDDCTDYDNHAHNVVTPVRVWAGFEGK